ncbi:MULTISPECIES: family 2 encapsulin nanocompartment cargo protein polyprenyl transferase [Actinomadura]|uniref:Family 2 encapsulin nanocompartment cargo protein polyprenyl transferase n=1 Tax=Actinomadura yumaensis TaxID=111807 RepID=A0ABW2CPL4_9ACTN|nr:family 2 encapsulin nanocompartment cargo protein polyprenyl transferase [Actinomadura sp. J1-007]MWK36557.1 polyprenyl synthetase family protein [Actinomadura sp. J1-007]
MAAAPGTARSAQEVLTWSRGLVEPALRRAVDGLPESMRRIGAYHFGWQDGRGGGKAIRPTLTLLAAEAVGGSAPDAVRAAVAVELAHNFSLLHDDVMDGDLTRRHRPTVWSVFGTNAAILAGDAMLACAFEILAEDHRPAAFRTLSTAVLDLTEGQSSDMSFEERSDVTLPECLEMARRKTGALIGAACALGAVYGGGTDARVGHLRAFGERLGLAFQLVDDLLGIWGDPAVTGKPVHNDLRSRKKSLPVVAALGSGTPAGRELTALYLRAEPLTGDEPARAAALIESAGGRSWAVERAAELLAEALTALDAAAPRPAAAEELKALAELVALRDH